MRKRRPHDRLTHWESRRMAMFSPKFPEFQALKEKINASSPKVTELEDDEGQRKKVMELMKWWITEWISDPNLLRQMVLHSTFLATINTFLNIYLKLRTMSIETIFSLALKISIFLKLEMVANATLPSCFWLAQERGFKTKITELIVCGYWVFMGSARESES
ncbi:hypothetical protein H5410_003546 [Solanum commersonii]|uniref:Uncharacterized protein n=1 Tax=Solanum commersonii TaxID=4109 RepID=A0A9J6B4Z7_SOLCO|nr:hypothetical protein H5410_003546 [Solanum commersonii]